MALTSSAMGPGWFMFFQTPCGGNESGQKLKEYGGGPLFPPKRLDEKFDEDEVIALSLLLARR